MALDALRNLIPKEKNNNKTKETVLIYNLIVNEDNNVKMFKSKTPSQGKLYSIRLLKYSRYFRACMRYKFHLSNYFPFRQINKLTATIEIQSNQICM